MRALQRHERSFITVSVILIAALLAILPEGGCSSPPPPKPTEISYSPSKAPVPAKRLWTHKTFGLVTDLDVSKDGSTVLVSTVPDRDSLDSKDNLSKYVVTFYSSSGKRLSRTIMPAQVKSQALSSDGSLAVIATYDDQIRGLSREGKELWATEAPCKPMFFGSSGSSEKVLCFHDDDAEPDLGFEVFDRTGKRLSKFPIHDDALGLKVSADDRYFALALTHGKVIVFNSRFQAIARKSVPGEIVDVAVAGVAHGRTGVGFAVLYNARRRKGPRQELWVKDRRTWEIPVAARVENLAISPDARAVFGYSNTDAGQLLARLSKARQDVWIHDDPKTAEYSSHLVDKNGVIWVGFQDAHVLGFNPAGKLLTDIRAPGQEGEFLYAFALSGSGQEIAVAMDGGTLSYFRVGR